MKLEIFTKTRKIYEYALRQTQGDNEYTNAY